MIQTPVLEERPPAGFGAAWSLAVREWKRFYRQKSRVFSALVTPALFWLLLGSGLNRSFAPGAAEGSPGETLGYLSFFFPGAVSMIVLFTAVFATITVVEDRREGFMQGVLASPAHRWSIPAGKVLGAMGIAMAHAMVFLLLWPLAGGGMAAGVGLLGWIQVLLVLVLLGGGLTALAFTIAWRMNSTAGFHAIMMVFLMPMWFLSGAVFPADGASGWIQGLMLANPLSYGQMLLTDILTAGQHGTGLGVGVGPAWLITAACCGLAMWLAIRSVVKVPGTPTL
ncbi:MAG: ABC transporter permease [Phycisphaeraceae bacterium]|nr:ABC transporter permease [Phycisphaeraceae bacterium]